MPDLQQNIRHRVCKLVHLAEPEIGETVKRTNQPYFMVNGNVCALRGTKDNVTVFLYDPIAPAPEKIISQGEGNKTARAIQIYQSY